MKRKHHLIIFWFILVGFTAGLALISGELLCRLAGVGKPNLTVTGPKQLFIPDPDPQLAFRMAPNYNDFVYGSDVSINPKGLRDKDYPYQKPDGVKRILILGDSVAFGYGVNEEDTFSKQWEQFLQEETPNQYQIINSGVPSYTTVQEIRWLEVEGLQYQPDAIVLTFVMNDPEPVHQLDENGSFIPLDIDYKYADIASLFPKPIVPFTQSLQLFNFINRLIQHTHPNWHEIHERLVHHFNAEIFETPHWVECQESMKRVKEICAERDMYLLVVIYPLMYRLHNVKDHNFSEHYDRVNQVLMDLKIPSIVPLDDFIGQKVDSMRAYVDDPHPSRASHRIMAQRLHHTFAGESSGIPKWEKYDNTANWKN